MNPMKLVTSHITFLTYSRKFNFYSVYITKMYHFYSVYNTKKHYFYPVYKT